MRGRRIRPAGGGRLVLVATIVFATFVLAAAPIVPGAEAAGRANAGGPLPIPLPASAEVRDPVFAILVGLVENDLYGTITQARFREEIARSGRETNLPIDQLTELRREPSPGRAEAVLTMVSRGAVNVPVPYNILSYHPGRFRASSVVVFDEWDLGTVSMEIEEKNGDRRRVTFVDVRLWGVRQGSLTMDVDGWLDRLLGAKLDDTQMVGVAVFRYEGALHAVATGYNNDGKGRSGALDFEQDELIFPNRPEFKAAGKYFRRQLELLMPGVIHPPSK